jgi:phosphate transport system substrate-binding protein
MALAVELRSAAFADPEAALFLRVGEQGRWPGPAYQLGVETLVIIIHPQNPLQALGEAELLDLFTGQAQSWPVTGAPVTVWAYAPGEDLSAAFDGLLLRGRPLASTARLAAGVEQMRDEIARDVNALGFTGQASAGEDVRILQTLGELPVLALTPREPDGLLRTLLACAQK